MGSFAAHEKKALGGGIVVCGSCGDEQVVEDICIDCDVCMPTVYNDGSPYSGCCTCSPQNKVPVTYTDSGGWETDEEWRKNKLKALGEEYTDFKKMHDELAARMEDAEKRYQQGLDYDAESFAAQDKKALAGGTLPTPMTWIDGGGQLPYSHVVVDVSGSMGATTFVPNYSGSETFSRSDYVMFLLLDMYHKGAIKADTRIYPIGNENKDWGSFISAGFLFGEQLTQWKGYGRQSNKEFAPEVWPILFGPRAGTTHLRQVTQLPKTKTLLITDVGASELPRALGVSKGSFNHNPPLDVISW